MSEKSSNPRLGDYFHSLFAAGALTSFILGLSNIMGADTLDDAIKIRAASEQRYDEAVKAQQLADAMPAGYTSNGKPVREHTYIMPPYPVLSPYKDIPSMEDARQERKEASRSWFSLSLLATFMGGSSSVARRAAKARRRSPVAAPAPDYFGAEAFASIQYDIPLKAAGPQPFSYEQGERGSATHVGVLGSVGLYGTDLPTLRTVTVRDKAAVVPAPEKIDPAYIVRFEPTVYSGLQEPPQTISIDELMAGPNEPTFSERWEQNYHHALQAREAQQRYETRSYDPFSTYHNVIGERLLTAA